MNEFLFIVGVAGVTFVCMATWFGGKELLTRWVNNDWCKHNWDMWGAVQHPGVGTHVQLRFCKKCNKAERRIL